LGLKADRVIHGDASQPAQWWDGIQFDRILADVPCSASGVTRRHPDIKWLRRESDISQFAAKQQEILEALWPTLSRGGKLLYVTCSVFDEENRLQVEAFLRRHADARPLLLPGAEITDGQLLPDSHHDGFFYALVRKV
jgi:16S rRNA (cytosine967-C5)-methyltransferase